VISLADKNVWAMYFSPTGKTKKIVTQIAMDLDMDMGVVVHMLTILPLVCNEE